VCLDDIHEKVKQLQAELRYEKQQNQDMKELLEEYLENHKADEETMKRLQTAVENLKTENELQKRNTEDIKKENEKLCNLLNEENEENNRMKKELELLKKTNDDDIKKENERLPEIILEERKDTKKMTDKMEKEIINLKSENKLGLSCAKLRLSWSALTYESLIKNVEFNGNITQAEVRSCSI